MHAVETLMDRPGFESAAALKLWLSETLAAETDPHVILRTTAEAVGRHLGVTRIGYGEIEPGEDWMTIPVDWTDGIPSLVGRLPIYRGNLFIQAYQRGETMVVADVRELGLPADEARMLEETYCRSCISVPLVDDGELVALFSATYREPRRWTEEEVAFVQSIGARTWAALGHARAVARLRESEEQFRQLAESFPGICWLSGLDGLTYWMNARGTEFYGDTGAAAGDAGSVVHPDDWSAVSALMTDGLRNGKAMEVTLRAKGVEGVYHPFLSRMVPIRDETGAIVRWCGIQVDLTEQQARDRHDTFFRKVSDAIREETDAAQILATVSSALQRHLDVARVLYSEVEKGSGLYTVHHGSARSGERWTNREFAMPDAFAALNGAFGRGETVVCRDVHALNNLVNEHVRDFFLSRGIAAGINVPLVKEGRLVAILSAQHGEPRDWTPDEVRLVEELAERTWSTVTRAQAEAALTERERHQRFLVEWTDALREQESEDAILETTLRRLVEHLGASRGNYSAVAEDGSAFTIRAEWRRDLAAACTIGNTYRLSTVGDGIPERFLRGEIVGSGDIEHDPRIDDDARARYRLRTVGAFLSAPLVRHGRVCAVFSLQQVAARTWREGEKRLLRDVAERAWAALERARAEAALKERERHGRFLIEWSDRLREQGDVSAIVDVTLERLATHLGTERSSYSELEDGPDGATVLAGWRRRDPEGTTTGPAIALGAIPAALRDRFKAGGIVAVDDADVDPRLGEEARTLFRSRQARAFVGVPLLRDGEARGMLAVQQNDPRVWREDEKRLLRDVADRAWVVLERARAEAALKERERHQRFMIAWTDDLREQTTVSGVLGATLERLAAHLGASRANYAEITGQREVHVLAEWRRAEAAATLGTRLPLDRFGPELGDRFIAGEVVAVDDILADPRLAASHRVVLERRRARAFVCVPLVRDGKVRAMLAVQQNDPRAWREDEKRLFRDVAERTWVVLERARAEEALKERERNQAFLIAWSDAVRAQTSPDGIIATTIEHLGRHLDAARANYAEGLDGGARFAVLQEWRRDAAPEGAPAPRREGLSDGVHDAYLTGDVVVVEDVHADDRFEPAAKQGYAEVDAVSFLGVPMIRGGRVRAVLSVQHARAHRWRPAEVQLMRDIADRTWVMLERARAEAALQERERDQAFVIEWSDAVRAEVGPRAILGTTLRRLGGYLGVERANYAEVVEPGDHMEVVQEWGWAESLLGRRYPFAALGERVVASHLSGRPLAVEDVTLHPLFDLASQSVYGAIGVRSGISVPLVRDGRLVAVLSVQSSRPRAWTDAEVRLVGEIADRTWTALDRARFEERMAESEALLATFMENAPIGMHLKDADGRYLRINQEVSVAVGRPREEILGRRVSDLLEPEVAREVERLERQAAAGQRVSVELSRAAPDLNDGRYAAALSIAFPIDGQGPARSGGFTIDLTDRKAAEAALQRSRDALYQTEKLSALGSLLAGVSHELNNPLSIVVAQAVMMERQAKGTELADRAFKIRRAADRCARIVQTFLAMARAKRPEREPVDLNAVAVAALDLADYNMRTSGVTVERRLAADLPRIAADADQLHQIIINLLVNAQQAMAEADAGERRLVLTTAIGPEPATVVIDVADTGPGIPDDIRRRVFEPFFTTKPQGEGTGVGLSFSQGLAEAHGGRLALLPSERGACFRLTLPIDSALTLPKVAPEPALPAPASRRRALVIDDEPEIAESLADFLIIEGYECEVAIGGAAGKARLADGQWDLVVSDLRMPEVDGPELHAWVAAMRPDLAGRMAFTTGDTLGASAERFLASARRPVLEKPFTPDSVRALIAQVEVA